MLFTIGAIKYILSLSLSIRNTRIDVSYDGAAPPRVCANIYCQFDGDRGLPLWCISITCASVIFVLCVVFATSLFAQQFTGLMAPGWYTRRRMSRWVRHVREEDGVLCLKPRSHRPTQLNSPEQFCWVESCRARWSRLKTRLQHLHPHACPY